LEKNKKRKKKEGKREKKGGCSLALKRERSLILASMPALYNQYNDIIKW